MSAGLVIGTQTQNPSSNVEPAECFQYQFFLSFKLKMRLQDSFSTHFSLLYVRVKNFNLQIDVISLV